MSTAIDVYCVNALCDGDSGYQGEFAIYTEHINTGKRDAELADEWNFDSKPENSFIEVQEAQSDARAKLEDDSDGSDIQSITSWEDLSSLTSQTSLTSGSLNSDTTNAIKDFVSVLLKDKALLPLLTDGAQKLPLYKLERNVSRLLREYGKDLASEVITPLEKEASQLVRVKSRVISHMLLSAFDPRISSKFMTLRELSGKDPLRQERVVRYLKHQLHGSDSTKVAKTQEPAEDQLLVDIGLNGSSSDEEEDENWSRLRNLHLVTNFMVTSHAFLKFRNNLKSFIYPSPKPKPRHIANKPKVASVLPLKSNLEFSVERALRCFKSMLPHGLALPITALLLKLFRPRVPPNHTRITWTCVSL